MNNLPAYLAVSASVPLGHPTQLLAALLLGACSIKERDQKGPEIHIAMEQSFIQVGDQNPVARVEQRRRRGRLEVDAVPDHQEDSRPAGGLRR